MGNAAMSADVREIFSRLMVTDKERNAFFFLSWVENDRRTIGLARSNGLSIVCSAVAVLRKLCIARDSSNTRSAKYVGHSSGNVKFTLTTDPVPLLRKQLINRTVRFPTGHLQRAGYTWWDSVFCLQLVQSSGSVFLWSLPRYMLLQRLCRKKIALGDPIDPKGDLSCRVFLTRIKEEDRTKILHCCVRTT